MTPIYSTSPSEIADGAPLWPHNNGNLIYFFGQKAQSLQDVEPLELYPYPQSPYGGTVLPIVRTRVRVEGLGHQMEVLSKVLEKRHDSSYNVVRNAACKCDYPNCQKAYRRNEHLKRHKQSIHGEGPNRFPCEFCGNDQFNRKDNLKNHRKLHARPHSRIQGVEFIPSAVPIIEQEERIRKKRVPPKSRLAANGAAGSKKRGGSY
ncbi:hypothetical protein V8C42DRAFT_337847 [Trichoderma barbatum]